MTSSRFTVSALLEPASDFSSTRWPLHLTVVGNFVLEGSTYDVRDFLVDVTASHPPLTLLGGRDDWLPGDQWVTRIEPNVALTELHQELRQGLLLLGARFEASGVMQHFAPHVAVQKTSRLRRGDTVMVGELALIDRAPGGDPTSHEIIARGKLQDLAALR
ncbi:hypothetical protein QMG83_12355 [Salinibacterium sp. G-O1]|uniref:2'-5' RNA ligase family protein n=1 Tax=Salinibacterium sp. G-O1 TaxID=3046208 RepID=UPI0024BBDA0E|nr:hypothetical protein [Salinibacterium sp. G-O1]MDJ0336018.1 hypothetical protein [Salinibacterium sp. G-O1]